MTSEPEGREEGATAVPDAADGAAATEATAAVEATAAEDARGETVEGAATPETLAGVEGAETPATMHTPAPSAEEARDTTITTTPPLPPDGAHIGNSLETIKTAVVWLVVIQILTILSPLLRASLKWALIVGAVLTLSSFAVAAVAYLRAQRAQRSFPE
jgi:hypothetical protein